MAPRIANRVGMNMDRLTPEEVERLLEGHQVPESLKPLQESLQSIRAAYTVPAASEVKAQHLQAMMAAFGQHAPATSSFRRVRRVRIMKRASIAVAASVLVGGSALAATGSLPAPAQDALAKVAHGVGINLPHTTPHPSPHVPDLPGPHFAEAKRNWLECVKERGKDACGPKPSATDFVNVTPKPTHEPASTEPSEHGVGNPHHSPEPTETANPGHGGPNPGSDHPTPVATAAAHGDGGDHGGVHTPQPVPTPHAGD